MSRIASIILIIALTLGLAPLAAREVAPAQVELASPDGRLRLTFGLGDQRNPEFEVTRGGTAIAAGSLGLKFAGSGVLRENLKLTRVRRAQRDKTYRIPVGKTSSARDHHNELVVSLQETAAPGRRLDIAFRAFNDGVAFRYLIPKQAALESFILTEEQTQLTFPGDPATLALPLDSYTTPYEKYYQRLPVSKIAPGRLIGLPLLMERSAAGTPIWMALTEASLTDYAGMYLSGVEGRPGTLQARLSPLPGRNDGAKVTGNSPHASPWRALMVAGGPGGLIESNLVFNLNEPSAIRDTSWIKPGKTTFPWWNHYVLEGVDFKPGVNTETMKHYIDFCAANGIPYHSLDGLDIAWYGGPIHPNGPTDITKGAPSIDLPELIRYAKQKGVKLRLWMHWKALQSQIDEAFPLYEKWGIEGVMIDFMDRDDQEMVRFYHEMARKAAKHHLTLTLHGAYKPTGMERTWPNVLSYEAVLNQEYNKWQPPGVRGTPPDHNLDVAFTRMLAGPLDYHQGGMRSVLPENYQWRDIAPPVQGTRGHQLAMYVVYQNHLPMMADYPTAYIGEPGFEFMVDVPVTWDETRVLQADLGKSIVIARRSGADWYLGGMTASPAKELNLPLDFLGSGTYRAELYLDNPSQGPNALTILDRTVAKPDRLRIAMPPSGGFAARLRPAKR